MIIVAQRKRDPKTWGMQDRGLEMQTKSKWKEWKFARSSLGMVFVEKLFFQSENEFEDIEMNIWENVLPN